MLVLVPLLHDSRNYLNVLLWGIMFLWRESGLEVSWTDGILVCMLVCDINDVAVLCCGVLL